MGFAPLNPSYYPFPPYLRAENFYFVSATKTPSQSGGGGLAAK
jgi:hypothetical protein